jgi:hypothetical protein
MVRRLFVSAFSSVVAVTASALYSASAAKAQNAPASPRPRMSPPEPEPIVVDQATADRARDLLDAVARGTFDRSELIPQLDAFVGPKAFPFGATLLSELGPPQSMYPFEKRIMADQTWTFFRVRYPKETLTWVVGVDPRNQITLLDLRRGPNNHIFDVAWRDIQY